jgi:hypothetical protein
MIELISAYTSVYFGGVHLWATIGGITRELIYCHLETSFLIFVLTNDTDRVLPTSKIVRNSVYFPW